MNSSIEWLNVWGGRLLDFALPILWQSSLLIAVIFAVDFLLRRKVRAAVRYSLWFVVFVKLLLPPTLALPTGAAWWLRSRPMSKVVAHTKRITVNYSEPDDAYVPSEESLAPVAPPAPKLSREAWLLLSAAVVSVLLALWVLLRWRQIARCVRRTTAATVEIAELLAEAHQLAGLRRSVTLRVTTEAMSPAVCGLFRPVILLPQSLIEKLTASQLRAVLLHELIHLQRRDVWVNCAQTLLQIVYWWHPLLWIANARMRRVREEAVDDAVMCALSTEAEVYAPTLLEVAKLAFARPLASLGLVGILESRSALRHRIERLLNFTTPRRAGVSMVSVICLAAFTALAVPMGEPPARPSPAATDELATEKLIPYRATVNTDVFIRNLQTRASATLHTTNDDLNDILVSIMDGFGVDCTGERAIQFDRATGVVTAKNSSEALGVLDEVVSELNLKGGERVLNPPQGLKEVLIEGQFYLVKQDQMEKFQLTSQSFHRGGEMTPWWELSPTDLTNVRQQLKELSVEPMMSPRIQTSHGITASMFMGDGTNNIRLECVPYVHDGMVNFTVLAGTTGEYAPGGKSWPDIAGHTNCAIFSQLTVTNGGAGLLRAEQKGVDGQLLVLLSVKILYPLRNPLPLTGNLPRPRQAPLSPADQKSIPVLGDLPGVGRLFRSQPSAATNPLADASTNLHTYTFRMDSDALHAQLKKFAENPTTHLTSQPATLADLLANAGVDTYSSGSFFYREENGHANLTLHTTLDQLQKAAQALGLDWKTEQALNDGKSIDITKLEETSTPVGSASGVKHYDVYYKTNENPAPGSLAEISQRVRQGKQLFEEGKLDEAESKLKDALTKDPNNATAQYYLSLIQRSRATKRDTIGNARARNVPGPDAQTNSIIHTSGDRQRIYEKLNSITFDKIGFTNLPLSEVALNLSLLTQRRDPDQQGMIFVMNQTRPKTNSETGEASTFDLGAVKIDLNPGLTNVRLVDVLEAITKSADHPINYAIVDYGIEFFSKGSEPMQLHTRTFNVDPRTFYEHLKNAANILTGSSQLTSLDSNTQIQLAVISFFNSIGVNLAAPKSVFFNDRQGKLIVHATDEDLELIEQAINTLNVAPPVVSLKARFVEVDQEFFKMLSTNGVGTPSNSAPNRILAEAQFNPIRKVLQQRDHADLVSEGEVTTLSGRQANFQVVDVQTVLLGSTNKIPPFATATLPFGTTLDVYPQVMADGHMIELTATPSISEFLGYENAKSGKIQKSFNATQVAGPASRMRKTTMDTMIPDGSTLMLSDFGDEWVTTKPDGIEIRKPYKNESPRRLVVFITSTILDHTGNRLNGGAASATVTPAANVQYTSQTTK